MSDLLIRYLLDNGLKPFVQIPFFSGRIDFVGMNGDQCIIIESKIGKWKKALTQAIRYGYAADEAYVALPSPTARYVFQNYENLFKKYGIGLLEVDKEKYKINLLLKSVNLESSETLKKKLINYLYKRKNNSMEKISALRTRRSI